MKYRTQHILAAGIIAFVLLLCTLAHVAQTTEAGSVTHSLQHPVDRGFPATLSLGDLQYGTGKPHLYRIDSSNVGDGK